MDAAQVKELMFATGLHDEKWGDTELDSFDLWGEINSVQVPNLGLVSIAESFGGEGQGDQYYLVFKVEFNEENSVNAHVPDVKYYRVDGYWASFGGGEYDGPFYEVQPVQRMVTFYDKISE